jgi:hypothetical protein
VYSYSDIMYTIMILIESLQFISIAPVTDNTIWLVIFFSHVVTFKASEFIDLKNGNYEQILA